MISCFNVLSNIVVDIFLWTKYFKKVGYILIFKNWRLRKALALQQSLVPYLVLHIVLQAFLGVIPDYRIRN